MSDNTKVTIIVDGLGKQEINLARKDATAIYVAASQGIINKLITKEETEHNHTCSCGGPCHSEDRKEDIDPMKIMRASVIREMNNETDKRIISELNSDHVRKSNIDLEESEDKPYPFTHEMFTKPLLVAYRCPECGKVTVRYLTLGESNEARCHWCKETAVIEKVVQSNIQCPNCDTLNRPYLANGLTELECVKCKAPIDVVYYKDGKRDRAKSANLIK